MCSFELWPMPSTTRAGRVPPVSTLSLSQSSTNRTLSQNPTPPPGRSLLARRARGKLFATAEQASWAKLVGGRTRRIPLELWCGPSPPWGICTTNHSPTFRGGCSISSPPCQGLHRILTLWCPGSFGMCRWYGASQLHAAKAHAQPDVQAPCAGSAARGLVMSWVGEHRTPPTKRRPMS
jgi:hypothetical protein